MPAAVEACVSSLKAKWKKDPKSRPKPQKPNQDPESQAWAICQAAQKAETAIEHVMLEGVGPVLAGIAATNRPHLPLPPMTLVGEGEAQRIRVPFLVQGIFKHPKYGNMVFNQNTYDRMLRNHDKGINHAGVALDVRHKPEIGALAWFDGRFGGEIKQEEEDGKKLLVGYGKPTSDQATAIVAGGQYRFASVDFYPNFESDVVELLSSDDIQEMTLEQLLQEDVNMADEYPVKNEDGTVLLSSDMFVEFEDGKNKIVELEKSMHDLQAKLEAAEAKVRDLEKESDDEDELPAEFRAMLEKRDREVADMQRRLLSAEVASLMANARARKDDAGRVHSPVLLEWADAVLQGKPVGDGQHAIRLEQGASEKYFFEAVAWLLDKLPGQVPVDGHTDADEQRLSGGGALRFEKSDFADFWGTSAAGGE